MATLGSRVPFVGRQRELATLTERLEAAGQDQGGIVLVAGEPGIGKTRLLAELASRARAQGWQVLSGRAYQSEGMPPYLPFTEALRDYVRRSPIEDLQTQLGAGASEVALVVPDVRRRLPDLPGSVPVGPEHDRYRLFESVCDFLLNAAVGSRVGEKSAVGSSSEAESLGRDAAAHAGSGQYETGARSSLASGASESSLEAGDDPVPTATQGLLLVLDDLHWADTPSLLLLQHLARRLATAPLLVAGAYRTVELDRGHPLTAALAELRREEIGQRLLLTPLASAEIAVLIEGLTGMHPAAEVVEAIERETDGNPFFVGEIVRHLQAEGRDLTDRRALIADWRIPEGVRQVIDARVSRLSPEAIRLLQVGAVLGGSLAFDVLRAASGIEESRLLDALDEALAASMLREEADGYRFSHALILQTIYEELSLPRRQRLHLRVAEAIEAIHGQHAESYSATLAAQYRLAGPAGNAERARSYSELAARQAAAAFAWEEAVEHYRAALQLLEQRHDNRKACSSDDMRQWVQLQVALAEAMGRTGELQGSIDLLRDALARAEAAGDLATSLDIRWKIIQAASAVDIDWADRPFVEESLAKVGEAPSRLRALFLATMAAWRDPECIAFAQEAMAMARQIGDPQAFIVAARRACRAATWQARFEVARPIAHALVQTCEGEGDRYWRNVAYQELFHVHFHPGQMREAKEAIEQGLVAALACRDSTSVLICRAHLHLVHCLAGQWPQADAVWGADRGRWAGSPEWAGLYVIAYSRWLRELWAGDPAAGWDLLRLLGAQSNALSRIAGLAIAARLRLIEGHWDEASESLRGCLALIRAYSNDFWRAQMAVTLPPAALALGDQAASAEAYRILLPYQDLLLEFGLPALELGRLTAAWEMWTESETHFQRAMAIASAEDLRPLLAEIALEWGRMLRARRGRDTLLRGRGLLGQALLLARDLGMQRHARDAQALLNSPQVIAPSPPTSTHPNGLSEREVEVLRLIAAGKSNPEIATALVISLNTVYRHTNHIFAKLGVSNRVEAATYAHRHGLV